MSIISLWSQKLGKEKNCYLKTGIKKTISEIHNWKNNIVLLEKMIKGDFADICGKIIQLTLIGGRPPCQVWAEGAGGPPRAWAEMISRDYF